MRKQRATGSCGLLHVCISILGHVHAIAVLSVAVFFFATLPAMAARSVTFDSGPSGIDCGTFVFTATGFGVAKTKLTITAKNTPGSPASMVIGHMTNSKNFAKSAAIPYLLGGSTAGSGGTNIVIRVTGPAKNYAITNLFLEPYTPFSWGSSTYCP